ARDLGDEGFADGGIAHNRFHYAIEITARSGASRDGEARRPYLPTLAGQAPALRALRHRMAGAMVGQDARAGVPRAKDGFGCLAQGCVSRGLWRGAAHRAGPARPWAGS